MKCLTEASPSHLEPPGQGPESTLDRVEPLLEAKGRATAAPNLEVDSTPRKGTELGIRKILVPTDFSPESGKAFEQAAVLAEQFGANLSILHVIDINAPPDVAEAGGARGHMQRLWDEGAAQVGRLAASLRGRVQARTLLEEGLPWERIVELSSDFDLLVLGKSRSQHRWKLFSRQTAHRVLQESACPVMVVHP